MASKLKWFSTDSGRKFSMGVAVLSSVSAFAVQWLPHTWLMDNYRNFIQLYKFGKPVPVDDELVSRAKAVQEDLKLKEKDNENIKYFTIYGFDIRHLGSLKFTSGVELGFPVNFSYKKPEDIDRQNIIVRNHRIDWLKPEAQVLQTSLLLSPAAQKFAIARELYLAASQQVLVNSAINFGGVAFYYYFTYAFNYRLNSFKRSLGFRMPLYVLVGLFSVTLWAFVKDLTTVSYEEWSDREASAVSEEYAIGAVEFYNKILQRNVALRALLGEQDGPKYYTAFGNDQTLFRTPHIPFTARRDAAVLRYEGILASKGNSPAVAEVVTV